MNPLDEVPEPPPEWRRAVLEESVAALGLELADLEAISRPDQLLRDRMLNLRQHIARCQVELEALAKSDIDL